MHNHNASSAVRELNETLSFLCLILSSFLAHCLLTSLNPKSVHYSHYKPLFSSYNLGHNWLRLFPPIQNPHPYALMINSMLNHVALLKPQLPH